MSTDLDAIERRHDTKRWPSVVHMNGRLLAPAETPRDVATLVAELRPSRDVVDAAREFLDELAGNLNYHYPPGRADRLSKLIDIAKARRP
jgi:hypothetical protein